MKENVLIIFSSGGGGLIQAAEAKRQEILKKTPDAKIIKKDLLVEWFPLSIGKIAAKTWDKAQKQGNVARLYRIQSFQWLSEFLFSPKIFLNMLKVLIKENINRVIDTQPVAPGPVLKAIRLVNYYYGKNIKLEKVVVDLPTDLNIHFFRPIRKLSKHDRKHLKLFTVDPLLKEGETAEEFWMRHCSLPLDQIYIQKYFIRQSFREYQKKSTINESVTITAKCYDVDEVSMTKDTLNGKDIDYKEKDMNFHYNIKAENCVYTILLGSQPAHDASIGYLKGLLNLTKQSKKQLTHIVFIFCSKHNNQNNSLFKTIADFAIQNNHFSNLVVVPLSFQVDDVIAPIFSRSNVTFTRSGGQTAMELMGVMRGKMFIHTEIKNDPTRENLLKGMFAWELGSALYLEQKKGATIVTPEIFEKHLESYF